MLLDDFFEHVPHMGAAPLDHPLGRLDVLGQFQVDQALHDKRLEQFERHLLGQTALVQAQGGPDNDDRTARVVHALSQQVLAEAPLLALEHVGEALERPVARARHGPSPAPVVEQGVDGFLQHALFVVDDDLGRAQVEQPLQPVVPVDHPAVEVVQVARGEPATVELDHGPQLGRDDRDDVEDHGPGVVDPAPGLVPPVESGDDLEALDGFLLTLHGKVAACPRRARSPRAALLPPRRGRSPRSTGRWPRPPCRRGNNRRSVPGVRATAARPR